jgi:glutamate synthase (NADPH/NADH) large chain
MASFQFPERDNCGVGVIVNKYGNKSHDILIKGIAALIKLSHRGAIQSDGRTGDGCGISIQIPDEFFRSVMNEDGGFQLKELYAAGNIFFSLEHISIAEQKSIINEECQNLGLADIFFRRVPINVSVLGRIAQSSLPLIEQLFINAPDGMPASEFELLLYALRKNIEFRFKEYRYFFICSLSSRTIIYKALCLPRIIKEFYLDLDNPLVKTSICVFHQRFSTNTEPSWHLAQPFRYLAHNGEINTVSTNRLWANSRGLSLLPKSVRDNLHRLSSIVNESGSDSFSLDNMLEMLTIAGVDFKQALRMLVPPYWENNNKLSPEVQKWYEAVGIGYEPWDGPAGIVFSNGIQVMCCLDRNGLRPLRYSITQDGTVVIASETGIIDYEAGDFVAKNRLGAGEMILIDTEAKITLFDKAIYRQYDLSLVESNNYKALELDKTDAVMLNHETDVYKKMFLVTNEEIESVIKVTAVDGMEATMSMGDDAAIAVLSDQIRPLTDYFRQGFAQVTNPAIDSIREKYVMSLNTYIGNKPDMINATELNGYALHSPLLSKSAFEYIIGETSAKTAEIKLSYNPDKETLEAAVKSLIIDAENLVAKGKTLIVLSDMDIDTKLITIPAAIALGAIHNHLVEKKLRLQVDLIVATGTARDPHHFCVLLAFGATAVYPYLSYKIIQDIHANGHTGRDLDALNKNYTAGINKGILKIMSKMGIATVASYRGSQLMEALGIDDEIVNLCFNAAVSRIKGLDFRTLEGELKQTARLAWDKTTAIEIGGNIKYSFRGEYHAFNPDVVAKLQLAVRSGAIEDYYAFAQEVNERNPSTLRDLFNIKLPDSSKKSPSRVDEIEQICYRFDSAAMSIGALSSEAHIALATAMNTIGGRSNSGEGGEDPARYGTIQNSKIKQIASGRFGVTPSYLMSAEIIQIKISQGAKPGEGGQLPGEKVSAEIARLRYATPGVTLISPPPHHDVYSIEDLAQLIFDLKQLNPGALISVKLVSNPGIGVIACGVAKAQADLITISGYDGGTGAAPVTSVKNVGSPWELGIAETHAALVQNNLRHKIRLQVDGGLKTGLDVIKAAILGAETFGFGTAPMVALGCKYLRICHLNNCATGVATQNEVLRKNHFKGLPDMVINYFKGVAHEVQQWLIKLKVANLVDLIGRTDLLEIVDTASSKNIDLSMILNYAGAESNYPLYYTEANIGHDKGVLNQRIYTDCMDAVYNNFNLSKNYTIYNTDRSVGATLAGAIATTYGVKGLEKPIALHFEGTAGQSFGTWATTGMELYLNGEANDYVAKGLAGGKIVIKHNNLNIAGVVTVMGNTCLYGATGGTLFANGGAGDRFAARNSGVIAVIEGLACNGCEYMTGGIVAILGDIDQNFGAGMTGGICYVWASTEHVLDNLNNDFVEAMSLQDIGDTYLEHKKYVQTLIQKHYSETHSSKAAQFLADFDSNVGELVLIKPKGISMQNLLNYHV